MDVRHSVRFYLNGEPVELSAFPPQQTVLDFLRLGRRLTGTKEGCAEGDCGACTVLVGRLDREDRLVYETINACIRFVASLDGAHLVTIEHLSEPDGALHPVQQAMIEKHGSQCGFCTPGIVMSLYGHWLDASFAGEEEVDRVMQGNLCRCTGYAPITRAALAIDEYGGRDGDRLLAGREEMAGKLKALRDGARVVVEHGGARAIIPADADNLAAIIEETPDATIVAGATDVGLWVTKALRQLPTIVLIGQVEELRRIEVGADAVTIGAAVSYENARATIAEHFPQLEALWDRIGGEQVRHAGTIGGNIANGSPIGDTPPALIALGATITLRRGSERRTLALEDFFIEYGRQDSRPGEFLEAVTIPRLPASEHYAAYKVSKRFDEDISTVMAAFRLRLDAGAVADVAIACGGMAGVPKRARTVEAALIGRPWTRGTVEAAFAAYEEDFRPLTDWRASADYRMRVAKNLLLRFWLETIGAPVRLREHEDG